MTTKSVVYEALIEARTKDAPYFQVVAFRVPCGTDIDRDDLWRRLDRWLCSRDACLVDIVDDEIYRPHEAAKAPREILSGEDDIAAVTGRMFHGKRPSWLTRIWRSFTARWS